MPARCPRPIPSRCSKPRRPTSRTSFCASSPTWRTCAAGTEREIADARTYAVTNFARDMLTVADNIRRGLESRAGRGPRRAPTAPSRRLVEGFELTERDLLKTLERHGVRRLEPQGQKFDPHLHQAMFEVPQPEVPAGTVVQVVQPGYVIGDRVLRPALVGVAKGGPKEPAPAREPSADGV